MTREKDTPQIRSADRPATGNQPTDYHGVSALLVFPNPVISDSICRELERNSTIVAEICPSEDDAIHLLEYIRFDVILTGYIAGTSDRIRFLETLRATCPSVPVIYYLLLQDIPAGNEIQGYGPVYFITRQTPGFGKEPDDLYPVIMQVISENGGRCVPELVPGGID